MHKAAKMYLKSWSDRDVEDAKNSKISFVHRPLDIQRLVDSEYWGSSCLNMFREFHAIISTIVKEKGMISVEEDSHQDKIARFKAMGSNGKIAEHYQRLEDLFNRTLESLITEEPKIVAHLKVAYPPVASSSVAVSRRPSKRDSSKMENAEGTEKPVKSLRRSARNVGKTLPM